MNEPQADGIGTEFQAVSLGTDHATARRGRRCPASTVQVQHRRPRQPCRPAEKLRRRVRRATSPCREHVKLAADVRSLSETGRCVNHNALSSPGLATQDLPVLERWLTGPRFAGLPARARGADGAGAVVRVLPAAHRGAGGAALGLHPPAGAAGAALRLGHLRRRRHARRRARTRPSPGIVRGNQPDPGRAPDLRRRHAGRGGRGGPAATGMPACAISWRCAATAAPGDDLRAASRQGYAYAADLVAGLQRVAPISRFRSPPIPETHPHARRARRTTSTT